MTKDRIQVLGITRWSYPFNSKGFRQSGGELADVRARLYAPHRLDHRLFLLEHVLVPGLRAQTDPDFTHLVLIGDQLPDPWRSRILEILKTVPQIIPVFRPEGEKHQDICRAVIQEHIDPECYATAQYRLDDDDGVSANFVEKTRSLFPDLKPFFKESGRLALDFSRGFILKSTEKDILMHPVSMRFWAPGMAIFQRPNSKKAVLDFHHLKIWHGMATLMWAEEPMFIRGAHHDNDSDLATFGRRTRGFSFTHRNPNRYFEKRFGLDLPVIEQTWERHKEHFLGMNNKPI